VPNLGEINEYYGRIGSPESFDISPEGKSIVAGDSFVDGFDVWDISRHEISKSVLLGSHWNDDVKFSPGGSQFVALGRDNNIRLYNTENFMLANEIQGVKVPSLHAKVYWSEDGNKIVWNGENENGESILQIWDTSTKEKSIINNSEETFDFEILKNAIRTTRGNDSTYQVWSREQNGDYELTAKILRDPNYSILDSSWSSNYEELAVCFTDLLNDRAKLVVFGPELKTLVEIEDRKIERFDAPAWSPDGKWLATIDETLCGAILCQGNNSVLTVRSADTLQTHLAHKIEPAGYTIKWSPDSKWLVATGSPMERGLTIYSVDQALPPLQIVEPTGTIESIDWSSDGKFIVVTGYNGVIYLYKADKILDRFFDFKLGESTP